MSKTKISEQLTKSIERLYKVGGLGLVFIFIATLAMIFSFFNPNSDLSRPMFIIGSILLISSFVLFILVQYNGPIKTRRLLKENEQLLDEIQELSLNLTKLTYNTQAYCFKNVGKIKVIVDSVVPLVKPFIGDKGRVMVTKIEDISAGIVEFSLSSEKVILDIKKALEDGDFKILKSYKEQLTELNSRFQTALKKDDQC